MRASPSGVREGYGGRKRDAGARNSELRPGDGKGGLDLREIAGGGDRGFEIRAREAGDADGGFGIGLEGKEGGGGEDGV